MTSPVTAIPQPAEARHRILAATLACFCEFGYEKSSMKQIAARAGVSQSLLHHHFESKDQLFKVAIDEMAASLFSMAQRELPAMGTLQERLRAAAELLYTLYVNNLPAVTFMVEFTAAANHNGVLRSAYLDYRATQQRNLGLVLRHILPGHGDDDLAGAVDLIETMLLGLAMRRPFAADESGFRETFDTLTSLLINHFDNRETERSTI